MNKKFVKFISTFLIQVLVIVIILFVFFGITPCNIRNMDKVDKITVYREKDGKSVTFTAQDDLTDEPFKHFKLSKNVVNMIRFKPIKYNASTKPEYIYYFYLKDGSVKEYGISAHFISINGKCYSHHSKSDFNLFKNITNNMYFYDY